MHHLNEGDSAPDFSGTIETGETVSLADYTGKKLILFFYPRDNTPGCTAEVCSLRDGFSDLKNRGYELLGVSPDAEVKHQKFIAKHDLPFPLLADTEKETMTAYGVWGPKKFMGRTYDGVHRTTFVIDEQGKVAKIIKKVKTKDHAHQVLDEMG